MRRALIAAMLAACWESSKPEPKGVVKTSQTCEVAAHGERRVGDDVIRLLRCVWPPFPDQARDPADPGGARLVLQRIHRQDLDEPLGTWDRGGTDRQHWELVGVLDGSIPTAVLVERHAGNDGQSRDSLTVRQLDEPTNTWELRFKEDAPHLVVSISPDLRTIVVRACAKLSPRQICDPDQAPSHELHWTGRAIER